MDANVATVLCSLIAMISAVSIAVIQHRSAKNKEKTDRELAAEKELEAQKKEAAEAEKKREQEKQKEQLDKMHEEIMGISKSVEKLGTDLGVLHQQVASMQQKVNARIGETEDRLDKVTKILSKHARLYSQLTTMQQQTGGRLEQMIRMETYNLQFTSDVATATESLANIMKRIHTQDDEAHALDEIVQSVAKTKHDFLQSMMKDTADEVRTQSHQQAPPKASAPDPEEDDSDIG